MPNNRYNFLTHQEESEAANLVKNAFLAAKNGYDVEEIVNGLLTTDEIIKLGRRIQIAFCLLSGMTGEETMQTLKVGANSVNLVSKHLSKYPKAFELINKRQKNVEKEYESKKYRMRGGSTLVHKKKEYTGFTEKDVKR